MQTKELQNGRLAMLAAAGFMAQEAVTGDTWGAYWVRTLPRERGGPACYLPGEIPSRSVLGARVWRGRRGLLAELSSTAHDGEGCQTRPSQREELPSCVSASMFWSFGVRALLVP